MQHEHPQLNAYHLKESLLYQFILAEMIQAFEQLKGINERCRHLEKKRMAQSVYQHLLNELAGRIKEMTGTTPDYSFLYSWNIENGSLAKLKHYWTFFCTLVEQEERDAVSLERQGSYGWFICMECLELICEIQTSPTKQKPKREILVEKLKRLDQTMHCFANHVSKWLPLFSRDEYVLYFLLRNQKSLDSIYGTGFFAGLLAKMHPRGIEGVAKFIVNRYRKLGFEELLPKIEQEIASLKIL